MVYGISKRNTKRSRLITPGHTQRGKELSFLMCRFWSIGAILGAGLFLGCGGDDGIVVPPPSSPIVFVSPESETKNVGAKVNKTIFVEDVENLFSAAFDIVYDPQILQFSSSSEGTFLSENGAVSTAFAAALEGGTQGRINVGITRLGQIGGISGDGVLCTIMFTAVGLGNSPVNFASPMELRDANDLVILDVSWLDASVGIQ